MRLPSATRAWMVLGSLAVWASLGAWGQGSGQSSSGQSLGDVARKTRNEHSAAGHVPASRVATEDDDGPDSGGVWRVKLCTRTPCYELSISLPKSPRWTRPAAQPRPVLIPVAGHEDDPDHAIRVYAAESLDPISYPDRAKRTFLQGWFARPEYFGQAAHLVQDERVLIDGSYATITHFTVQSGVAKFRGLSVVAPSPNGNYGFACVFREEDAGAAASVCDAIVKSAKSQALEPAKPVFYPTYRSPAYYPPSGRRYDDPRNDDPRNDDPPDDPPEPDDPE